MIKNFIKIALRSLLKNKGFTAVNIFGLALGIATCLLIVAYVNDELSFDRYNTKSDRIYRVNNDIKFGGNEKSYAIVPAPAAAALKNDFPGVQNAVRLAQRGGVQVTKGDQHIQEDKVVYADPSLFKIFTLPMVTGNPSTALSEPHSVVVTESTARKFFNNTDVLGKTLTFNDTAFYKITGVIKDIPKQSHFNFDFFVSLSTLPESRQDTWLVPAFNTYILLRPGADEKKLAAKLPGFMVKHAGPQLQGMLHLSFDQFEKAGNGMKFSLTPLTSIHLHSNRVGELGTNGSITYVYIFSLIALFVLLLACVNFMNLSTARSSNRAKEVGVRKVLGSSRKYLVAQFLTESVLVAFASTVIGVVIAFSLLPLFNDLSGKELTVTAHLAALLLPGLIGVTLVVGCLAGAYPAFFLSGFQPVAVLKGKLASGFKGGRIRSILVVSQFSVSIFLIIGTLIIYKQLKYIQNKDLGYNRQHILIIKNVSLLGNQAIVFKKEIKQLAGVSNATLTGYLPTTGYDNIVPLSKISQLDPKEAVKTQVWDVDADYIPTLGIKMAAGRNFSGQMLTDSNKMVVNEAAAKLIGTNSPINEKLYEPQDDLGKSMKEFSVIGVMKNFNFKSLRENVTPMIFILGNDNRALSIRIKSADVPVLMAQVEETWKKFSPGQPLVFSFMDQDFDAVYKTERRMGAVFICFAVLAIIIACLGLFGLATYAAEQRAKEIGVRKLLGASVSAIVTMLSVDFIQLIIISSIIASPIAWWAMQKWLRGFAYRATVQWWIFLVAGGVVVVIAFISISSQAIKAALTNPIKRLKSE